MKLYIVVQKGTQRFVSAHSTKESAEDMIIRYKRNVPFLDYVIEEEYLFD